MGEARASVAAIAAQAEEAKIGLEKSALFAPFDGVISLMNIREGDFIAGADPDPRDAVQAANAAVVVMDDSRFEVTLYLPPHEVATLREDLPAFIAIESDAIVQAIDQGAHPQVLAGRIWSVSPAVSLQRRAVGVKVRAEGSTGVVRDGAYVSVWIAAAQAPDALSVPYTALDQQGDRARVFVLNREAGTVARREVELGLLGLERAQVVSGLHAGDWIVTAGQHRLRDGSAVGLIGAEEAAP